MHEENFWYGHVPPGVGVFSKNPPDENLMTAIAVAYDPKYSHFIIAADGRCASATTPIVIETDKQTKIFHIRNHHVSFGYAFAGFGHTQNNSFSTTSETERQIQRLIKRSFHDGYELCQKFCSNLAKAFETARQSNVISQFPVAADKTEEKQQLVLVLVCFGFFKQKPFLRTAFLRYDIEDGKVYVTYEKDPLLSRFNVPSVITQKRP
jgi:hypothetical protein